ncbi:MAG: hypothetical protein QOI99_2217 [Actinomycetota bacterium]|nr:hypothetical protein [Actinomycetota bacterium]
MSTNTTRLRPTWRWSGLHVGIGLALLAGLTASAGPAHANHRIAGGWHQTKMHSAAAGQEENVCVQAGASHTGNANLRDNVRRKLYVDNPAEDWDLVADNRIWLNMPLVNGAAQPCSAFPNRASIPIEVYSSHNTTIKDPNWFFANACNADVACTSNDVQVWNPVVGHWDRRDSYIWFPERTLYDTAQVNPDGTHPWHNDFQRAYVVSHEFGHVFGLGDGGGDLCGGSIMHAGKNGCVPISVFWPTQIDRNSVDNIARFG